MKVLLLLAILIPTQVPTQALGQIWEELAVGNKGRFLFDVDFLNVDTGILVGEAYGSMTYDGGRTWEPMIATYSTLYCAQFITPLEIRAVGVAVDFERPLLLSSTDGGATWSHTLLPFTGMVWKMSWPSVDTGFLTNDRHSDSPESHGRLFRTTDRGRTWSVVVRTDSADAMDAKFVTFADSKNGYAGFGNNVVDLVFRTRDGGETWTREGKQFFRIKSLPNRVWLGIPHTMSSVYRSTDDGITWDSVVFTDGKKVAKFQTTRENHVVVSVSDAAYDLAVSTDGGLTWRFIPKLVVEVWEMIFPSQTIAYMIDWRNFFKSYTGGEPRSSVRLPTPVASRHMLGGYFCHDHIHGARIYDVLGRCVHASPGPDDNIKLSQGTYTVVPSDGPSYRILLMQ